MVANPGQESPDNTALGQLRDTVKDLNETINKEIKVGGRVTLAIFTFAILQLVIGIVQLGIDVIPEHQEYLRVCLVAVAVAVCFYLFYLTFKSDDE